MTNDRIDELGDRADEQMSDDEIAETAEIRAEIEETRLELGGTLNQLGERLEPSRLMDQAKENVREATIGRVEETAKGMSDMVIETIKRNPIPAAIAGTGLALLWANRSGGASNGSNSSRRYEYGTTQQPGVGERVGDVASSVGGTVTGAVGQAGETIGQVGQTVGQGASQAAGEVGFRLERFMQASPMALGAIAVGVGAIAGALLPETSKEQEMLGDAGQKIGDIVKDGVDLASTKAEDALDRTEEKVGSAN